MGQTFSITEGDIFREKSAVSGESGIVAAEVVVRMQPPPPQERLAALERRITERALRHWEPDDEKRGAVLPFREKKQKKVTLALWRFNPPVSIPSPTEEITTSLVLFRTALLERARQGEDRAIRALGDLAPSLASLPSHASQVNEIVAVLVEQAREGERRAMEALVDLVPALASLPSQASQATKIVIVLVGQARRGNSNAIRALGKLGSALVSLSSQASQVNKIVAVLVDWAREGEWRAMSALGNLVPALASLPSQASQVNEIVTLRVEKAIRRGNREAIDALVDLVPALASLSSSASQVSEVVTALSEAVTVLVDWARQGYGEAIRALVDLVPVLASLPSQASQVNEIVTVLIERAREDELAAMYALVALAPKLASLNESPASQVSEIVTVLVEKASRCEVWAKEALQKWMDQGYQVLLLPPPASAPYAVLTVWKLACGGHPLALEPLVASHTSPQILGWDSPSRMRLQLPDGTIVTLDVTESRPPEE